tara:strand:+ start:282 stop:860 length:579 start_codon:yes stop_codon:yes gene_type:complete
MKKLLAIIILSLYFITSSQADDIRDFEIEGMSIGDSLLDHFSENEIKNFTITTYQNNTDEYIMLTGAEDKSQEYDSLSFHVKKNDNQYIIHSISGSLYYEKNFNKCLNKKKKIVESLKFNFGNLKSDEYDYKYDWDLNSIAYISDFDFKNGAVRVYCINWSEVTEKKRNFADNLSVTIQINYFTEWLNNRIN